MDLQENTYKQVKKTCYMSAGFVDFGDLNIDISLEVQDKTYSQISYLINYIAYGLHLWYKILIIKEICRKPIPLHPGLGSGLSFGPGEADLMQQHLPSAAGGWPPHPTTAALAIALEGVDPLQHRSKSWAGGGAPSEANKTIY